MKSCCKLGKGEHANDVDGGAHTNEKFLASGVLRKCAIYEHSSGLSDHDRTPNQSLLLCVNGSESFAGHQLFEINPGRLKHRQCRGNTSPAPHGLSDPKYKRPQTIGCQKSRTREAALPS